MGRRGPQPRDRCVNWHDLTDPDNIKLVKRGPYIERQCKPCAQERARRWWAKQKGK